MHTFKVYILNEHIITKPKEAPLLNKLKITVPDNGSGRNMYFLHRVVKRIQTIHNNMHNLNAL